MANEKHLTPRIFSTEEFGLASLESRLMFVGLATLSNKSGVFRWKPRTLKYRIMPADDVNPDDVLAELVDRGLVRRFVNNGKAYGVIAKEGQR